ncbi:MAG TPA: hypothetical protein VMU95_18905 [Trebonia sp.]|nr:hypothetical protein [Trebonia sp.]
MEHGEDRTAGRSTTRSGTGTIPRQRPTRSATSRPRSAPGASGDPGNPPEAAQRPSGAAQRSDGASQRSGGAAQRSGEEAQRSGGASRRSGEEAQRPSGTQAARRRVPPQFSGAAPAGRAPGKAADPAAPARGPRGGVRPAARPVQAPDAPAAPRRTPVQPAVGEPQAVPAAARRPGQAPATAGSRAAQKMPFLLLVCGLLGGAMASALGITVTLSSGSFQITELQQQDNQLVRQSLALQDQVASARSSAVIEQRAYELGMRPVGLIRYLDLNNGQIETGGGNGVTGQTP